MNNAKTMDNGHSQNVFLFGVNTHHIRLRTFIKYEIHLIVVLMRLIYIVISNFQISSRCGISFEISLHCEIELIKLIHLHFVFITIMHGGIHIRMISFTSHHVWINMLTLQRTTHIIACTEASSRHHQQCNAYQSLASSLREWNNANAHLTNDD